MHGKAKVADSMSLVRGRDLVIGGGRDSIALWLAIAGIIITPIAYPIQRRYRLWRSKAKSPNGSNEKH